MTDAAYTTDSEALRDEIRAVPVTMGALELPSQQSMSPEHLDLLGRIFDKIKTGHPSAINALKKLVKIYPKTPSLRNQLAAAYKSGGKESLAEKIEREIVREFPDYLFARLNQANKVTLEGGGNLEGVQVHLGQTLRLVDCYPDRDLFHWSELRSFYFAVGAFHVKSIFGIHSIC